MDRLDAHAERLIQRDPGSILRVAAQLKIGAVPMLCKRAETLDECGGDALPAVRFVHADVVKQQNLPRLQHGKLGLPNIICRIGENRVFFAGKQELALLHSSPKNGRLKGLVNLPEKVGPPRKMHFVCLPCQCVDRLKVSRLRKAERHHFSSALW